MMDTPTSELRNDRRAARPGDEGAAKPEVAPVRGAPLANMPEATTAIGILERFGELNWALYRGGDNECERER